MNVIRNNLNERFKVGEWCTTDREELCKILGTTLDGRILTQNFYILPCGCLEGDGGTTGTSENLRKFDGVIETEPECSYCRDETLRYVKED